MGYHAALITGASRGLGRALAIELARRGTRVVLCARNSDALHELAREIGTSASAHVVDVAKTSEAVAAFRRIDSDVGGIDLVIANAGVGAPRDGVMPYEWEAISAACHTNFCGAAATLTALIPAMIERGKGHLVGISSLASYGALPGGAAYCAPKAGLSMLLDCLRVDLATTPVDVTDVHPGFVRTRIVEHAKHPLPMLMETDEAARHIVLRLTGAPARIAFPRPLAVAARVGGALPPALRDALVRRLPH